MAFRCDDLYTPHEYVLIKTVSHQKCVQSSIHNFQIIFVCTKKRLNHTIISIYDQLSLFHTFYMSFIPPKSQLSQIEWKTKVTKDPKHWWDSGGMNFKMVPIIISLNLLFGPEIMMIKKNPEGWMVGVWDGDRWDLSHPF